MLLWSSASRNLPVFIGALAAGAITLIILHLKAAGLERGRDEPVTSSPADDGYINVAKVADLPLNEAVSACLSGERVAVLRYLEDDVEKSLRFQGSASTRMAPSPKVNLFTAASRVRGTVTNTNLSPVPLRLLSPKKSPRSKCAFLTAKSLCTQPRIPPEPT